MDVSRDPYEWIDPSRMLVLEDLLRQSLRIERRAYELCHAERVKLQAELKEIKGRGQQGR